MRIDENNQELHYLQNGMEMPLLCPTFPTGIVFTTNFPLIEAVQRRGEGRGRERERDPCLYSLEFIRYTEIMVIKTM